MTSIETNLDHVALFVRDQQSLVQWYHEALGLVEEARFEYTLHVGAVRAVVLAAPAGFHLELHQLIDGSPAERDRADAPVLGLSHLGLEVSDLDGSYSQLVAAGAQPALAPQPGALAGTRIAAVADPEGNLIELLARAAASAAGADPEVH
jgi:lactoylglutathione lyase